MFGCWCSQKLPFYEAIVYQATCYPIALPGEQRHTPQPLTRRHDMICLQATQRLLGAWVVEGGSQKMSLKLSTLSGFVCFGFLIAFCIGEVNSSSSLKPPVSATQLSAQNVVVKFTLPQPSELKAEISCSTPCRIYLAALTADECVLIYPPVSSIDTTSKSTTVSVDLPAELLRDARNGDCELRLWASGSDAPLIKSADLSEKNSKSIVTAPKSFFETIESAISKGEAIVAQFNLPNIEVAFMPPPPPPPPPKKVEPPPQPAKPAQPAENEPDKTSEETTAEEPSTDETSTAASDPAPTTPYVDLNSIHDSQSNAASNQDGLEMKPLTDEELRQLQKYQQEDGGK